MEDDVLGYRNFPLLRPAHTSPGRYCGTVTLAALVQDLKHSSSFASLEKSNLSSPPFGDLMEKRKKSIETPSIHFRLYLYLSPGF